MTHISKLFLMVVILFTATKATCATTIQNVIPPIEGSIDALFSVAEGKKVRFSNGNLQYHPVQNTWQFAPHQYDVIGRNNLCVSSSYDGWIDLFGWGASGYGLKFPTASTVSSGDYFDEESDIAYTRYDWGVNNKISNGGNKEGLWRTLTRKEWQYLFMEREDAPYLIAFGQIDNICGIFVMPDNWVCPSSLSVKTFATNGMNLTYWGYWHSNVYTNHFTDNMFSLEQWDLLEKTGVVFLPEGGYRVGTFQFGNPTGQSLYYWSSSAGADEEDFDNEDDDKDIKDCAGFVNALYEMNNMLLRTHLGAMRYLAYSVRLVSDAETDNRNMPTLMATEGYVCGKFSVSDTSMVLFSKGNLQYNPAQNTWQFATHQYDMIGNKNLRISSSYDGWIDLFGWGTSGYNSQKPWSVSMENHDYGDSNRDICGTNYDWGLFNRIIGGGNTTDCWRTITSDEMSYLLCNRKNAENLIGWATVDGVQGLIVLPDDWVCPKQQQFVPTKMENKGNHYLAYGIDTYTDNVYTEEDWEQMEQAGAVFFPAAGYRAGNIQYIENVQEGSYWTGSTGYSSFYAKKFMFMGKGHQVMISPVFNMTRRMGCSVRLVTDVKSTTIIKNTTSERAFNDKTYSLSGIRCSADYKGVVVKAGRKYMQK